ncbi:hypothetical protein F4780DRAFT_48046 [Xylariomycetidae sp. FL0641]|nr:hypothetical protein F4780DRAFT_48046 [Xylariomycetidae sp. FL0641]
MALVGLSLLLASIIYIALRGRPPFMQTLRALWRGQPRVPPGPPPTTAGPNLAAEPSAQTDGPDAKPKPESNGDAAGKDKADRATMPPPPPPPVIRMSDDSDDTSSQSTPKATAASSSPAANSSSSGRSNSSIPSLTLSASPPASAAAVARAADATHSPGTQLPTLSAPAPSPPSPATSTSAKASSPVMAPPPRPPTLNGVNNARSTAPPPAPSRARQPGSSTLAPPPTHSSRPAKPARGGKITLAPGHSPLDWARLAQHPDADLRGLGPGAAYLRVPPSLLKQHNGRKGNAAWTALGGRVYNITPYLPFHPGGEPELLRAAGKDGTRIFGEVHPWVNFETMLGSCLIGLLVEEGEAVSSGEMEAMD